MATPLTYGDVRDVLMGLPFPPDAGTSYALTDLFTVRHEIISKLDPPPRSVFEFGTLYGFFLVTALDACPSVTRVGWVDNESYAARSNDMCLLNVTATKATTNWVYGFGRDGPRAARMYDPDPIWELVQVDGDHTEEGCLADLRAAENLKPKWIFIDDWTSGTHGEEIGRAVERFLKDSSSSWGLDEYRTVNGLAVLTKGGTGAYVRPLSERPIGSF